MSAQFHDARPLIVHVVHRFALGGLENGVVNLINRLPHDHWRHAVIALTDVSDEFRRRVERDDVQYAALQKGPGHLHRHYPRLVARLRKLRPAIVHTRNLAALEASVPAWIARAPVRIHGEHGWDTVDLDGANARLRLARRLYSPFVTQYVALSGHIRDYLVERVGIAPARVARICNGVDTARFRPPAGGRGAIPGCPFTDPAHWLVGTAGRLHAVKDQVNLAHAFVRALVRDPTAAARLRLVLVGDGPTRAEIEQVLSQGGARELAWLAGERDDVPDVLRGLDLFVLPSLAEGISNSILEAMATGLPVVATKVGGNAELVEAGLTGELVPRADPEALAGAMLRYFHQAPTARRHGKAGRNRVERAFSIARMAGDYERLYTGLLEARGIAHPTLTRA
jgi:sugar transferase (PEP-CTERM/EpsH1 system associated)